MTDALTTLNRKRIIDFAAAHRIPAMYEFDFLVRDGGLMSYGWDLDDNLRRAAVYVDRILKGAKPGDLPGGAADALLPPHQPQDRQSARPDDPAVGAAAGG